MYPVPARIKGGNVFRSRAEEANGDWCPSRSSKSVRRLTPVGGFDSRPPPLEAEAFPPCPVPLTRPPAPPVPRASSDSGPPPL